MNGINLIPQRRREAKLRRRHLRWCVAGCCAYALAAGAAGAGAMYSWGGRDVAVTRQLARANQDIQGRGHALAAARTRLAAVRINLEVDHQIADRPDFSQLLALLARESRGQIVLRNCQLRPRIPRADDATPGFVLTAAGAARAPADAQEYALRLQDSGMFARVTLLDTRREPFLDLPASSFRIECELGSARSAGADPRPGRPQ